MRFPTALSFWWFFSIQFLFSLSFSFSLLRNVFLRLRFFEEKKLYSKFSLDCKRNLFYIRIINIQNINSYFFWAQHYQINLPNRWWPNTLESIFFENFRHFLLICFFFCRFVWQLSCQYIYFSYVFYSFYTSQKRLLDGYWAKQFFINTCAKSIIHDIL